MAEEKTLKNEKMSDEELDNVAGGSSEELSELVRAMHGTGKSLSHAEVLDIIKNYRG